MRFVENFIEELFNVTGYQCEEWVGVKESITRFGIFADSAKPDVKVIFCLESARCKRKLDLLLPVHEPLALSWIASSNTKH